MLQHASPRRSLALVVLALAAAGCAGAQRPRSEDLPSWPVPPDKPRVKFVRQIVNEDDLPQGAWRRFVRVFVPSDPETAVQQPTGLALSPDERYLYVASASTSKVLRFDLAEGAVTRIANADGARPASPFGLTTDGEGNLYVSDLRSGVFVYAPDGKLLRQITENLSHPTGVAVDDRRKLLYVVAGTVRNGGEHRVEVFSLDGRHVRTIGARGSGGGQFNYPTDVAVAKDGNLFVVDMLNFRVQIFDPEGRLAAMFGQLGAGEPGTFDKAKSVAFDTHGNIYVVDSQQALVQIFNSKFQPLMAFGGRLALPGFMSSPNAIAISSKNTIYVADFYAGRVNEYQLVNTVAGDSFEEPAKAAGASPRP